MKKKLFLLCFLIASFFSSAQNVGIGTTTPLARLHVADSSVLFSANGSIPATIGLPPLQGAGRRMMWFPDMAAFRVGFVNGAQWDSINLGLFSIAMGFATTASGNSSTAIGRGTIGNGFVSTATGYLTIASGDYSTAMGDYSNAAADFSVAIGESVTANSWISTSLGRYNDPIATSPTTTWALVEPLLIVGNGTSPSDKKNAFAISKGGNIYIDPSNRNDGNLNGNMLLFGTFNGTGEGISSRRTPGSNQYGLDFYAGSFSRMSISNGGNVGIGSSSPGEKLTIVSADNISTTDIAAFYPNNFSQGIGIGYDEIRKIGTTANSDLFINAKGSGNLILENSATGKVGIGTSIPQQNLSVQNGMNIDQADGNTGTTGNAITFGYNSGEGIGSKRNAGGNQWGLDLYTSGANRMSITNGGNVGIGITNPATKLQVSAGDGSLASFGPNSYGAQLYIGATPNNQTTASIAQVITSDGNLHIDPASGKNIYVGYFQARDIYLNPAGGKVGIGTTTPATTLEVNGYTKLGNNAPSIKTLKLTGTTAATQGGFVDFFHGLDPSKILSVTVFAYSGGSGIWIPPNFHVFAGADYDWFSGFGAIRVINISGNSASILSVPLKILITYEE